ncbi:MAG: glycosyltransferase [Cyanobacteria bacterium P01_C01_bin.120]
MPNFLNQEDASGLDRIDTLTPFVSVIIPVFNDFLQLLVCLQSLKKQSYHKNLYEIIVVNNNSTDEFDASVIEFEGVNLYVEEIPGSYAARNKGISVAKGSVIAFIDSDCRAQNQWIESGIAALQENSADLVGGQVSFSFSAQKTSAELYDSLTNMQIKRDIEKRKVSKTANLFVRRKVFDAIGLFPLLKSGGDVAWTKRATDAGYLLVYSRKAEVFHPTRKLPELLKKQYRVGSGQTSVWVSEGQSIKQIFLGSLFNLWPPTADKFLSNVGSEREEEAKARLLSILVVIWLCNVANTLGRLTTILELVIQKK